MRCNKPGSASQAEYAGSIPVIRSTKHLVRGCFRRVVFGCRALLVPRPLVKSGRYRRSGLRWSHERPGRDPVEVRIKLRSQAEKLMFPLVMCRLPVSWCGPRLWVGSECGRSSTMRTGRHPTTLSVCLDRVPPKCKFRPGAPISTAVAARYPFCDESHIPVIRAAFSRPGGEH